jgi:shikimate kinase
VGAGLVAEGTGPLAAGEAGSAPAFVAIIPANRPIAKILEFFIVSTVPTPQLHY